MKTFAEYIKWINEWFPPNTSGTVELWRAVKMAIPHDCFVGTCQLGYGVLHPLWRSETWRRGL